MSKYYLDCTIIQKLKVLYTKKNRHAQITNNENVPTGDISEFNIFIVKLCMHNLKIYICSHVLRNK